MPICTLYVTAYSFYFKIFDTRTFIMSILTCPVCKDELLFENKTAKCKNNHSFDIAKEGYVNLLSSHKSGDSTGDNKEMALSRRSFLEKGFYSTLADAVGGCIEKYTSDGDTILDICCGEGYYTDFLAKKYSNRSYYGFDLSKNMVRLAAKRHTGALFFVANIASIPVKSNSVSLAFHLFAPFHSGEFARILCNDGVIVTAIPGREHLFGLKSVLYEKPYYNDEKPPLADGLELTDTIRVKRTIELCSKQDIKALFQMTPYYYHTPSEGMKRLDMLQTLSTPIEFVLLVYKKAKTQNSNLS